MDLTKNKTLNDLLKKLESINLTTTETKALENYMKVTEVLDSFSKTVKDELKTRLEAGEKVPSYILAKRSTKTYEDECYTISELQKLGYTLSEFSSTKLLPCQDIISLVGSKTAENLKIVEKTTKYIRKNTKKVK